MRSTGIISHKKNKPIYIKNKVKGKILQHYKSCLQLNSINSFTTISDLFHYFEDIFDNFHQNKHVIEKFGELKMRTRLFYDFYSEVI